MRQNVNHTDRLVWVCRHEDMLDKVEQLKKLSAREFRGPYPNKDGGGGVCVSNSAGLQVMAPADGTSTPLARRLHRILATRGEGVVAVLFSVPDISAAKRRVQALGYAPGDLIDNSGEAPWAKEVGRMVTTVVCQVMKTTFVYTEIEYADHILSTAGTSPRAVRSNNRLDHVCWVSTSRNFDGNIQMLSDLGGTRLDGPYDNHQMGLRIALSWETGLEVITPLDGSEAPVSRAVTRALDERGEGVWAAVFGVTDMTVALDRARSAGYIPHEPFQGDPEAPWARKYLSFSEAIVGDVMNTIFMYSVIEYPDTVFVTRGSASDR